MKTKTKLTIIGGSLVLILLIILSIYSWPVRIKEDIDGILFRSDISGNETKLTLHMDGHYFRNIFSKDEYLGVFDLLGLSLPEDLKRTERTNMYFNKDGYGSLFYQNESEWLSIGTVFMNLKNREIVFTIYEGAGTEIGSWSSAGGLIFSAPSSNRQEAAKLANELMDSLLKIPVR